MLPPLKLEPVAGFHSNVHLSILSVLFCLIRLKFHTAIIVIDVNQEDYCVC